MGKRTYIFVNNEKFLVCARLLLNFPMEASQNLNDIKSIDEVAERIEQTLWQNIILEESSAEHPRLQDITITPEEEFRGHCSNIQAFFENGLQTEILASNIAFPLLKKLVDLGFKPAIRVFKEEIAKRFNEGVKSSRLFLLKGGYLSYLDSEEKQLLKGYDELCRDIIEEVFDCITFPPKLIIIQPYRMDLAHLTQDREIFFLG